MANIFGLFNKPVKILSVSRLKFKSKKCLTHSMNRPGVYLVQGGVAGGGGDLGGCVHVVGVPHPS